MECVDEFFGKWRLEANAKKSGVMVVRGGKNTRSEDELPYMLGGENVPVVDYYKYLGIMFNSQWNWTDHVEYVCGKMERAVNKLEYRLWKNRAVDVKTKVIAWSSIFRPVIEYGAEVWWPGAAEMDRVERIQKRVCKWMLGVCRTTIDEVVLGELGIPTVESRFVRARLAWAGWVRCAEVGSIVGLCGALEVKSRRNAHTWERNWWVLSRN